MSARGRLSACILALAAFIGLGIPALAQDSSNLTAGQNVWNRAGCFNCHGENAGGGNGGDSPVGPSLRTTALDKETMALIVSCGLPGTPMPSWLKGAYTEVECYGMPLGSPPAGLSVPRPFTAEEITALVDFIFANFVQTPQN
jgi:mono/diheme cytochrome c family protein